MANIKQQDLALNINEVKDYISKIIVNNYRLEAEAGRKGIAISLKAGAGIGKTSALKQLSSDGIIVKQKDRNGNISTVKKTVFVKSLSIAQLEETGDLCGFPVTEFKVQDAQGKVQWVPESQMGQYKSLHKSRMSYAKPEWLVEGMESNADYKILVLDDVTRANQSILQAAMEIVDQKEYVSWKLGPEWNIFLTENPDNENYNVNSFDAAGSSRFITYDVKYDNEIWCNWALASGVDSRAVNFILSTHGDIYGKNDALNPRIVTKFFDIIKYVPDYASPQGRAFVMYNAQAIIPGDDGIQFAAIFQSFIDNKLDKLPTPLEILNKKDPADTLKIVSSVVYDEDDSYRGDVAAILMFRIANYLLSSETKIPQNQMINTAKLLVSDKIQEDLSLGICDRIANGSKKASGNDLIARLLTCDKELSKKLIS